MRDPKPAERHYEGTDNNMRSRVAVIRNLFTDDLDDFTAFDADFTTGYNTTWGTELAAAQAVPSDEALADQLRQLTEAVDAAMAAGRDKWTEVKYFMEKAFPASAGKQAEFGADDFRAARDTQDKMIAFLTQLHTAATQTENKAALIAKKYSQAQIDGIDTLRQNLYNANLAQETFKKSRKKDTEDRINTLNAPYDRMLKVNEAAQIVYMNSAAKRAQYVFNPHSGGGDGQQYIGTVGDGEVKTIATLSYAAGRTVKLENTGSTTLLLSLSATEGAPEGNPLDAAAGGEQSKTMAELNEDTSATFLLIKGSGGIGEYIVTVGD